MSSMDNTMQFNFNDDSFDKDVREVLLSVYDALEEKGYNPINQIVGYLLSGDPAIYQDIKMHVHSFANLNEMN